MSEPPLEVDTIRLRGRVSDAVVIENLANTRASRLFDERQGGSRHVLVGGTDTLRSGARVGVDVANGGIPEGWVEFSAPKVGTGSNVVALPLRQAVDVAREVYEEARDLVEWSEPFDQLRVQRIDLDRDFEAVDRGDVLLAALSRVQAPNQPKTRFYPDPERGGAATLTRGPASRWLATLYSKEGEARHRLRYAKPDDRAALARDVEAADGRLRYEVRLRSEVLGDPRANAYESSAALRRGPGLRVVRDLDEERLAALRRHYFERVGYGLEVTGMQRAVATVMGAELRADQRYALVGWLFCEAQGLAPQVDRNNSRRYRNRARDLGVGAADLLELATGESVRLDYEHGRMVAA